MAVEQWTLGGASFNDPSNGLKIRALERSIARRRAAWLENPDADGAVLGQVPRAGLQEIVFRLQYSEQSSMDTALTKMAAVIDKVEACKLDSDGLALVWTPHGSTKSGTFRALLGEVVELPVELGGDGFGWFQGAPVFVVALTCLPFWSGTELATPIDESWTAPAGSVTIPDVPGDASALGELVVTNDEATDPVRWLMWGSGPNAGGIIDSDALVTSGFSGAGATRTGAYDVGGGNTVIRATLIDSPIAVCGTGELTHRGTYRVLARVYSTTAVGTYVRLVWQDKDGPFTANAWATPPVHEWGKVDLGVITLTETDIGDQVWSGRIEAYGQVGVSLDIDFLVLVPVTDGHGLARAVVPASVGTLAAFDDFTSTTSGNALGTRTPVLGAAWATSGAATDFAFIDAGAAGGNTTEAISRSVSTTSLRFAVLGSAMTNMDVQATVGIESTAANDTGVSLVIARFTDSNNYLALRLTWQAGITLTYWDVTVTLQKVVAGSTTSLGSKNGRVYSANPVVDVSVLVTASGKVTATVNDSTRAIVSPLVAVDSVLATGGALASGKGGVGDAGDGDVVERWYDDVAVYTPPAEPIVIYAGQDFRVTHNEAVRGDSDGGRYGVPPSYQPAGHFRIQPEGDAGRSTHLVVIGSPTDLDTTNWSTIDHSLTAAVTYTPRGNAIPR